MNKSNKLYSIIYCIFEVLYIILFFAAPLFYNCGYNITFADIIHNQWSISKCDWLWLCTSILCVVGWITAVIGVFKGSRAAMISGTVLTFSIFCWLAAKLQEVPCYHLLYGSYIMLIINIIVLIMSLKGPRKVMRWFWGIIIYVQCRRGNILFKVYCPSLTSIQRAEMPSITCISALFGMLNVECWPWVPPLISKNIFSSKIS